MEFVHATDKDIATCTKAIDSAKFENSTIVDIPVVSENLTCFDMEFEFLDKVYENISRITNGEEFWNWNASIWVNVLEFLNNEDLW